MEVKKVVAKNFRSFKELEWTLPTNGLYLVEGSNLDTGGSNASGKSTLLDTIFWGLYGWLPKWEGPKGGPADAVIYRGESSCTVQLTLKHDGKEIYIERKRPNKLKLVVDGQDREGKADDLNKQIEALVMSPERLLLGLYLHQNRTTSFFSMSDADRSKLLTTISGLDDIEAALENVQNKRSQVKSELEKAQGYETAQKESIEVFNKEIIRLELAKEEAIKEYEIYAQLHEETKNHLNENKLRAQNTTMIKQMEVETAYASRKAQNEAKLTQLLAFKIELERKPRPSEPPAPQDKYLKLGELKQALVNGLRTNKERQEIQKSNTQLSIKISMLVSKAESLGNGQCQACGQNLPHDPDALDNILSQVSELEKQVKEVPEEFDDVSCRMQIDTLNNEIKEFENNFYAETKERDNSLNLLIKEIQYLSESIKGQEFQKYMEIKSIMSELQSITSQIDKEINDVDNNKNKLSDKVTNAQNAIEGIKNNLQKIQTSLSNNAEQQSALNRELDILLDLADLFGPKGYRTVCFDELIYRISEKADSLLNQMTNGTYSSKLEMAKEDSKGQKKTSLFPVLVKNGVEVPKDDLSGGMLMRVCLAYDLAISEVIDPISPLFIDEATDGMDDVAKAEVIGILDKLSFNRPIFVIDHTNEIKGAFANSIGIIYKNGESKLV